MGKQIYYSWLHVDLQLQSKVCMHTCVSVLQVMHVCACECVCVQRRVPKEVVQEEEYFKLMGVFRCSVMKQISTAPCMPASVVYLYTLLESHNTSQSGGSTI